ncbi:hypothetical protein [Profundibacter amoris]|uniref:Uncharacterized protein n=1 Tax=Profundibacter amoris TaxID=2171755 RepID=A0A347UJ64_9RHOB|nr:hypothetical protein [Profundibacter amoris]AXX98892.1 hypothetical protein BAR1_13720 [Profundibacter amoris]
MPSQAEYFKNFISTLKDQKVLNDQEIEEALKYLDGIKGVFSDKFFISGYENLAWFICKKFMVQRLKEFIKQNTEMLVQDKGARFYFVQALLEKPGITDPERKELILIAPEIYQTYLLGRFFR